MNGTTDATDATAPAGTTRQTPGIQPRPQPGLRPQLRPPLWPWLALGVAGGCPGPLETDGPGDTEVPADTDVAPSPASAARLLGALHAPVGWARWVAATAAASPACPAVTALDAERRELRGGCTDADGVRFEGRIEWLEAERGRRVLFEGWRAEADPAGDAPADLAILSGFAGPAGDALAGAVYDGEIVLFPEGVWQADYTARAPDGGDTDDPVAPGGIVYAYADLQFLPGETAASVFFDLGRGEYAVSGSLTAATSDAAPGGAFAVSGGALHLGTCASEPDQGTIAMSGPRAVSVTFNGGAICDGCTPISDGGQAVESCR